MADERMFREERLQRISERVLAERKVHIRDLAAEFGVSKSSIRLDLAELETRGLVTRTHGGAILSDRLDGRVITSKSSLELRKEALRAEKEAIGRAAAALVEDGDTLMIDGGSTTLYLVRHLLGKQGLTIITVAVNLLPDLLTIPDAQIYVVGGLLDRNFATTCGEMAVDGLERFRTSKAIMGIDGISVADGLSVTNPFVAALKRKMMANSEQSIVVCDHTKLDHVCLIPLAPLAEMDYLVTDSGARPETVGAIRACGSQVVVASSEEPGGH